MSKWSKSLLFTNNLSLVCTCNCKTFSLRRVGRGVEKKRPAPGLGVLLHPTEMQGVSLVVMQHLHLMVGEAEEVAEIKQKYHQRV